MGDLGDRDRMPFQVPGKVAQTEMALRALIFDFDGLIVDTESSSFEHAREAYARHGLELSTALWRRYVGSHLDPYEHLQRRVGPGVDIAAERNELTVRHRRTVAQLGPREGVAELVAAAAAAGLRLGVASSSSHLWVDGHLDRIGLLDSFAAVCCRDDVRHTKPAPDVYLAVLERLETSATEAVAFEDSPNGAQAAKAAGIYTVAVPNDVTRGWPFDHADRVADSLGGVTVQQVDRWLQLRPPVNELDPQDRAPVQVRGGNDGGSALPASIASGPARSSSGTTHGMDGMSPCLTSGGAGYTLGGPGPRFERVGGDGMVIADKPELRTTYREPGARAAQKVVDHLDRHCRDFIALSPFCVISTAGANGQADASPRGDPPGFVATPDPHTLLLPDRPGNNQIDSLQNIVEQPRWGCCSSCRE